VIDPRNVAMMNTMLEETLRSGTARKAELPGWVAAGKTGTSQDFRDAWFIGYTTNLVTGVWLGNDDNSPTKKAVGGGLPVEIWSRFMRAAHQGVPVASLPTSQAPGFFNNVAQGPQATISQITAPSAPPASASLAPYTPMAPSRAPQARNTSTRPEADSGLDGWLVQRLFGGR
jgi:penicillin-binding protein 1A